MTELQCVFSMPQYNKGTFSTCKGPYLHLKNKKPTCQRRGCIKILMSLQFRSAKISELSLLSLLEFPEKAVHKEGIDCNN